MKQQLFLLLLLATTLWGCDDNHTNSLDPIGNEQPGIGVDASTKAFTRADESADLTLQTQGFRVWTNYAYASDGEFVTIFADSCVYNEGWKFKTPHLWPDSTSNFDFYAVSPGFYAPEEEIEDRFYYEGDNLYLELSEVNFYGYYDIMLARTLGISSKSNNGSVSFAFDHLMTKVTLQIAFHDELESSYPLYMGNIVLYGDRCNTYNVSSDNWLVYEALPDDFDIEDPGELEPSYNLGPLGEENFLSATPAGEEWVYRTAAVGYVLPQKYKAQCILCGIESVEDGDPDRCAEGTFDLDFTGMAGQHIILKVTATASGEGYSSTLQLQLSEDELTTID